MVGGRALITGISGQLGSYLSEHLREQGYLVGGTSQLAWELPSIQFQPHEIYVLDIVRPTRDETLEMSLGMGLMHVAGLIERWPEAKILVPDSYAATQGVGPKNWLKDKELTRKLVSMHSDRVVMPTLSQFISPRGRPDRMYLMWVLHELAAGRVPKPSRPLDIVRPGHAKEGAFKLAEGMQGRWASVPEPEAMTVAQFISLAQTPGSWVHCIVEEVKHGRK